jgi:hypothetical protein
MEIIVLTEDRKEMGDDFGPGDAVAYPKGVHAAPADPDVPGDPAERTFCGKSTAGMERTHHSPSRPGQSWCPAGLARFRCDACDTALHSL